ncbi:MAG: murein hydrolase activator EnvC family protein [Flavobacteriales bacterium]|jgi:septal ring factor EnvC (AmiA/AmiB activator)
MKTIKILALLLIFIGFSVAFSQNKKEDLQKQREEINAKIALTKKLIRESESNQKVTSSQLAILNEQLTYREQLLRNINRDINNIDGEIGSKEANISNLNSELEKLKKEYARMVVQAYKNRSSYDKLMYIFSSKNFNQAFKRLKLTQHYAATRKKHVAEIEETKTEISVNIQALQADKQEKERLANAKEKEKKEIAQNKESQQQKLSSLQKEEKKLRDQQKKQESDRKKLSAKIEEIIKKEIEDARRKEKERAEAEAKKNAAAGTAGTKPNDKSTTKPITAAPEVVALSADFEKNKGTLPWPISSGVITQRFGKHPHASIAGIEVNSNGVDFVTEKDASVYAVFGGTVTSIFSIPGAGQNVIVTHGSYKTVYSGLTNVSVSIGDKVATKEKIGNVLYDGEEYTMHFEVWKVNAESGTAQNPESWIKRR